MSLFQIFDIAGSGMSAQSIRLNTTASNIANVESISGNPNDVYKARQPVFQAAIDALNGGFSDSDNAATGVRVAGIVESNKPATLRYAPHHPLADDKGYIYVPNVNAIEEMANMISASRSYQTNVEILNATKQMVQRTLTLGQ